MTTPLKIQIIVDDQGSVKIRQVGTEAEKAGRKGTESFRKTGRSLDEMNRHAVSARSHMLKLAGAVVSLGALYLVIRKINQEVSEFIDLAGKQEAVEKRVEAVLKATAEAAGYNLAQITAMASGMQKMTTTADEVVLAGQAILLTFKKIRGEGFERAMMAALDMAEVMEGDLKGAVVMIGKALNDPIANLSAMTRAGVQFIDGQKDMIKQLWKSGKEMEAQEIILKELESQFGGTAAAARETFLGIRDATKNAYGDMYEQLGFVITKSQVFIDIMGLAEQTFIEWGDAIKDNREDLADLAKSGVLFLIDTLVVAIKTIKGVVLGFENIENLSLAIYETWVKMEVIWTKLKIAFGFVELKDGQRVLTDLEDVLVDISVEFVRLAEEQEKTIEAFNKTIKAVTEYKARLKEAGSVTADTTEDIKRLAKATTDAAGTGATAWRAYSAELAYVYSDFAYNARDAIESATDAYTGGMFDIVEETEETTDLVQELWIRSMNRVQESLADTFDTLFSGKLDNAEDIFFSFLADIRRMAAEHAAKMTMYDLFGIGKAGSGWGGLLAAIGGAVGSAGSGVTGSPGAMQGGEDGGITGEDVLNYARLANSLRSIYQYASALWSGGTTSGMGGAVSGGAGTGMFAGAATQPSIWAPAVGYAAAPAVAPGTAPMATLSSTGPGAAVIAAIVAWALIMQHQDRPDASLSVGLEMKISEAQEELFESTATMINNAGFDEKDVPPALKRIADELDKAFGVYEGIYEFIGPESKDKLKAAMKDLDDWFMYVTLWAREGTPVEAAWSDTGKGQWEWGGQGRWEEGGGGEWGWTRAGASGTVPEVLQNKLGKIFGDYIEEAVTNVQTEEIFQYLTDEIQEGIRGATKAAFMDDPDAFFKGAGEGLAKAMRASKIWEEFEKFIEGDTSVKFTMLDRLTLQAQDIVTGWAATMAKFGEELTKEELAEKFTDVLKALKEGTGIRSLGALSAKYSVLDSALQLVDAQFGAHLELLKEQGVAVSKITDLEDKRNKALERTRRELTDAVMGDVNRTIDALAGINTPLADAIAGITAGFQGVYDALAGINIADFSKEIESYKDELERLESASGDTADIRNLSRIITELGEGADLSGEALGWLQDKLKTLDEGITPDKILRGAEGLAMGMSNLFANNVKMIQDMYPKDQAGLPVYSSYMYDFEEASAKFAEAIANLSKAGTLDVLPGLIDAATLANADWVDSVRAFINSQIMYDPQAQFSPLVKHLQQLVLMSDSWAVALDTLEKQIDKAGSPEEYAKLKKMIDDINAGTGDFGQVIDYLGKELEALEAAKGSAEEIRELTKKIEDLEEASAQYLKYQEEELRMIKAKLGLIEDSPESLALDAVLSRYKDFGDSLGELLNAFSGASLDQLKNVADALGISLAQLYRDMGILADNAGTGTAAGITAIQQALWALQGITDDEEKKLIEKKYGYAPGTMTKDWWEDIWEKIGKFGVEDLEQLAERLGVTWQELIRDLGFLKEYFDDAGDAAGDLGNDLKQLAQQIRDTLQGIQDEIDFYNFGGSRPDYLMKQILDIQQIPMSMMTGENLLAMSDKLAQWYSAEVEAAQQAAQEEANVARLWEQVAERVATLVDRVDETIRNIKNSYLNVSLPYQKAVESQGDYDTLYAAALSGGPGDVEKYLGFAGTHLKMQQEDKKSSQAYQDIYASVMGDMETIRGRAEAGGYDQMIYEELTRGNEEVHVDLTAINATFENLEAWILEALQTLEALSLIINIDWENWTGDMTEALGMLLQLVEVYGWDHEYTLTFLAEVPLDIFENLNHLAVAAGWIADQSGGWSSLATIAFVKNVAANWEFDNIGQILAAAGWIASQAPGGWTAEASLEFILSLQDRFGVPWDNMPYWLQQMGIKDYAIPDMIAKLILQAEGGGIPIDGIDDYLTSLGITDQELHRTLKVQLIYEMHATGDLSSPDLADWAFVQALSASTEEQGSAIAVELLTQLKMLASLMAAGATAAIAGGWIGETSPLAMSEGWTHATGSTALPGVYDYHGVSWAQGGIVDQPTFGLVGEAGYPEAIIPMMDGYSIPVKWVNGGSNQAGAGRGEEVALLREQNDLLAQLVVQNGRPIEIGGARLDRYVDGRSDNVRRLAERRRLGTRRMF